MSNHLAIATSTYVLRGILDAAAKKAVPGASAKARRPADPDTQTAPLVTLFLYQVTPNGSLSNQDIPTRGSGNGRVLKKPQVALNLHYLLSFFGDDAKLEPQRLLGKVVATLHGHPQLSREEIATAIAMAETDTTPANDYIVTSDLADQVELVKFSPISLNLEELSKLWSVFFRQEYSLSVAYAASVVLIEDDVMEQRALPVRSRWVGTASLELPLIARVEPQTLPWGPARPLELRGRNLGIEGARVRFGDVEVDPLSARDDRLLVSVPAEVPAGVRSVQVVEFAPMGDPPAPRLARASNRGWFVRQPGVEIVSNDPAGGPPPGRTIGLQVEPPVGAEQEVILLLNEMGDTPGRPPRQYSFPARTPRADPTSSVMVDAPGLVTGEYLARVSVDGAESALLDAPVPPGSSAPPPYVGPQVVVP
ncbi:MAG: hypothetical protein QOJ57_39 [Thermoleophilaceae bacterium]|nr:hypothetical protein [Thermoleophilaceae bacterium]